MKLKSIIFRFAAKRNTNKGSYTLEASIFLPLFIVGVLTLGFTIRMISAAENISFAATDEARLIAESAYTIPVAPQFSGNVQNRLLEENPDISSVKVQDFRYLYPYMEFDGLISFRLDYWIDTGLPLGMIDGMEVSQQYRCRGFLGRTVQGTPIPFDEMETNMEANMVWIFPDEGKRYHTKTCSIISSYPIQTVLTEEIRKHYKPCQKCSSGDAKNGSLICCFQAYGEAYHLQACPTVDKYIISIEKEQAEARGYTPCLKCGGIQ